MRDSQIPVCELRARGRSSHGLTLEESGMSENRLTKCVKRISRKVKGEERKGRERGEEGRKGTNTLENVS